MKYDIVSMDFDFVNMKNYTVGAGFGWLLPDFGSGNTDLYTILL
jgi:Na+-transporting NADH:ubiquinone oxidoreductase subunit NqrE